jgi:hypothetical protein
MKRVYAGIAIGVGRQYRMMLNFFLVLFHLFSTSLAVLNYLCQYSQEELRSIFDDLQTKEDHHIPKLNS